jgi:hypothetical protein
MAKGLILSIQMQAEVVDAEKASQFNSHNYSFLGFVFCENELNLFDFILKFEAYKNIEIVAKLFSIV